MNQDWDKVGKSIRNIVEEAVNSQDFSQLNKTISETVNEAVGGIQKGLRTAGKAINESAGRKSDRWYGTNESDSKAEKEKKYLRKSDLFLKNTSVKAGGLALTICGCTFNIIFGIAVAVLCLVSLFLGEISLGIKIALAILIPFLAGSAVMTWKGSSLLSAVKRYRNYIAGLKGKTYCNIKELAEQNGKSASFVVKDVRKMIEKGWFRQGHFDHENECLIVSDETYQEYQALKKQRLELQNQQQIENQKKNESQNYSEADKVTKEGQEYLCRIRSCKEAISGEEILKKISHMELLINKIFDRVKQDPKALDDIKKMMEYYLPTTVKLLEAYEQLNRQPIQGDNIYSSKKEIEETLDTLNKAFEKLLDSLFEDVAWDVSSDISVLNVMLAQEGLTESEWKE